MSSVIELPAKRYGAYHRVSDAAGRELDDETTHTAKEAWAQIDAWGKLRGIDTSERYLDWDTSGKSMDRPELERLLADLDAGRIAGVVVSQVDRLSRAEVGDALATVRQIAGVDNDADDDTPRRPLVLLDLGIDPSTEFGEFGLTILLGLSRMQWRRYKRQYASAQKRAAKRGVWIGPAPLGYRKDSAGALVLDKRRAPIMREAFRIAARDGVGAADEYLAGKIKGRRRHVTDMRRLLANRAYLGEHHHPDGVGHDAITTPATFEAAQSVSRGRRANGEYPLTNLATCANCGAGLTGALQSVRGKSYRRMRCSAGCDGGVGSVSADALEQHVRERITAELAKTPGRFRVRHDVVGVEDAERALERAESTRRAFVTDTETRAELEPDDWRAALRAHNDKVNSARGALRDLAGQSARSSDFPSADELGDPEQLTRAVAAGVERLVVAGGRGAIGDRVGVDFVGDELDDGTGILAA